jgi:hypothetical protein
LPDTTLTSNTNPKAKTNVSHDWLLDRDQLHLEVPGRAITLLAIVAVVESPAKAASSASSLSRR